VSTLTEILFRPAPIWFSRIASSLGLFSRVPCYLLIAGFILREDATWQNALMTAVFLILLAADAKEIAGHAIRKFHDPSYAKWKAGRFTSDDSPAIS